MDLVKECRIFKGENGGSKSEFEPRHEKSTRKATVWFPNRSHINPAVHTWKMDRGWKFWI